jgi:hypothetical protein
VDPGEDLRQQLGRDDAEKGSIRPDFQVIPRADRAAPAATLITDDEREGHSVSRILSKDQTKVPSGVESR